MPVSMRGRTGAGSTTSGRGSKSDNGNMAAKCPPQYKDANWSFGNKITSFRTLFNQTHGPARFGRPTTAVLNSFANWINKGAIVQTCSTAQVSKWARNVNCNFSAKSATTTTCKNILDKKFGKAAIKAVARTKSGSFMVVTAPTNNGKTFCFPK